uniref:EF-hand domain-containing protein n=1 Tax=Cannabis sativa TaxID=3483 RepID=A0A803PN51_CANSA
MRIAILNDSTLTDFIQDTESFDNGVTKCFEALDIDGDGMLSRQELRDGFGKALPIGTVGKEMVDNLFDTVIGRFDVEGKGSIGRDEFKSLSKEMLMAMARGIGGTPILLAIHQDSLLLIAVDHEKR